jgi:hypothetical protein
MRSSAFKWLTIILLPTTIGWKAVVTPEDPTEVQNAIVQFLVGQRFEVRVTDETIEYTPIIEATDQDCRLRVVRVSPLGHQMDLVRKASAQDQHLFYVFRGRVYREQPVRQTLISYFWFRFLRELGIVTRVPPVLAVATSCAAEQLPWNSLGAQGPT